MQKKGVSLLVSGLFLTLIAIAFFVLTHNTFFLSDDYVVSIGSDKNFISSFKQIFDSIANFYVHWGGGVVCKFFQFLFCGYISNKLVFDIANTIVFCLFLVTSTKLIDNKRNLNCIALVLFSLASWFLLPQQNETLFWIVGSTAYLWTTVQSLLFLLMLDAFKDRKNNVVTLVLLGLASLFLGTSHYLSSVSISFALIVYYLIFHRKEINVNVLVMSIMYGIGTIILIVAPGNYIRQASIEASHVEHMYVAKTLLGTIKIFYILCASCIICFIADKKRTCNFFKENLLLFSILIMSVVALCFIFYSSIRTAFFPEVIALILLLKLLIPILPKYAKKAIAVVLFVALLFDWTSAYIDIVRQKENNEKFLSDLVVNGGELCYETIPNSHRMANPVRYEDWTYRALKMKFNLDDINLRPYPYCKILEGTAFSTDNVIEGYPESYQVDNWLIVRALTTDSAVVGKYCDIHYYNENSIGSKKETDVCYYMFTEPYFSDSQYNYFFFRPRGNEIYIQYVNVY